MIFRLDASDAGQVRQVVECAGSLLIKEREGDQVIGPSLLWLVLAVEFNDLRNLLVQFQVVTC